MPNVHELISRLCDPVHPLPGSPLPACLPAEAADVRQAVLLPSGSRGLSDPVARVVHAHARSVDRPIKTYATTHDVPLIALERGQRKDDVVAAHRARRPLDDGVVVIGVAQEKMRAFKAQKRFGPQGGVTFDFSRQAVAVNHYYFYVQDPEWGPAFLKLGTYLPYPIKLCLNGHEWVKQQLRRADIGVESLDNGLLACADPARLQAICDHLGPADVQAFFDRWTARLPAPLTATDRGAGYTHRLALQKTARN